MVFGRWGLGPGWHFYVSVRPVKSPVPPGSVNRQQEHRQALQQVGCEPPLPGLPGVAARFVIMNHGILGAHGEGTPPSQSGLSCLWGDCVSADRV